MRPRIGTPMNVPTVTPAVAISHSVADAAITIGVVILLARALFISEKPAKEQDETTGGETAAGD